MKFRFLLLGFSLVLVPCIYGQDPHFTQFTSAPFTVNPAYAGVFKGTARVMSNYRQQWANLVDPFTTATLAADFKLGDYNPNTGQHPFNMGIQFMQDKSMAGAFKSSYVGVMASYHVKLDELDNQSLGAGLSINYGNRRIDFSSISFDRQFASGGYNLSLPNGEAALQNMKPFLSVGAGLLYRFSRPFAGTYIEFGVSGFHFNKPVQTVLADPKQILPIRLSGQLTFQQYLSDAALLDIRALYQSQADVNYLLTGFTISKLLGEEKQHKIGAGLWYRSGESFAPQVIMEYSRLQVGFSYDIAYNELKKSLTPASSFELSLQCRFGE